MIRSSKKNLKLFIFSTLLFFLSTVLIFSIIKFGVPFIVYIHSLFLNKKEETQADQYSQFVPKPIIHYPFEATNSSRIEINGKSFIDGTLNIFCSGEKADSLKILKNEDFLIFVNLNEGENNIYGVVQNNQGKNSPPSETLVVTLKTTSPALEIISPASNSHFYGDKQKKVQIIGKSDEDATVFVNDRQTITDKISNFNSIFTLSEGENMIKITAQDKFGNKTEVDLTLFFTP